MVGRVFLALAAAAALAVGALAQGPVDDKPLVSPMFSDHMVLQRDQAIPVWGWAAPNSQVTVRLGDKKATATAGSDGRWMAKLGKLKAGGPYMLIVSGPKTETFSDVLIGDVWLCSGQSNMEMGVLQAGHGEEEAQNANHPQIRLYTVPRNIQPAPVDTNPSEWKVCTPASIRPGVFNGFSAAAYYFGRSLQQHLNVPIGLIHTSWGGTVIEAWTSADALNRVPEFRKAIAAVKAEAKSNDHATPAERLDQWWRDNDLGSAKSPGWESPDLDVSGWKTMDLPNPWETTGLPDYDGVVWFRKEIDLPASADGQSAVLSLGNVDDRDVTWINGTRVGSTDSVDVVRKYNVPTGVLKSGRNVIAVRVLDTGGAGGFTGKTEDMHLDVAGSDPISLAGTWSYRPTADLAKTPLPISVNDNPNLATVLYNGMIAPVAPFAIKGALWYQGESNAGRAYQYRTLLPNMIRNWRDVWGEGDFPFFIVQLANYTARLDQPGDSDWAELREAQLMTVERTPKTGLAVAIDIGEAGDIHPKNKQEVGERLALAARHVAYGEDIPYSGPIYRSMKVEGGSIRLAFDHTDGGLPQRGGKLEGFAIAGADRKFVWADARVDDGGTVVVSSVSVPNPVAVRYAWAENPAATLYNGAGLPASPFRTDDWPGVTKPKS